MIENSHDHLSSRFFQIHSIINLMKKEMPCGRCLKKTHNSQITTASWICKIHTKRAWFCSAMMAYMVQTEYRLVSLTRTGFSGIKESVSFGHLRSAFKARFSCNENLCVPVVMTRDREGNDPDIPVWKFIEHLPRHMACSNSCPLGLEERRIVVVVV